MPRKVKLNEVEQGQITILNQEGLSYREIGRRLGRSKDAVYNFLRDPENYRAKKHSGRPKKLDERTKRRIFQELSNSTKGCRTIRNELAPGVSHVTVWKAVKSSPNLIRQRLLKRPKLEQRHKEARLNFAEQRVWWTSKWNTVVFSDEKKWNLDGPDGFAYYWRDLRKDARVFSTRGFGGGSVMTWAAITKFGRLALVFVDGRMNSESYQTILAEHLLPLLQRLHRFP